MIVYKIDVVKALTEHGYSPTRIRKEKVISESTMTNLRHGKSISVDTLNTICCILRCQPGDIIEVIPNDDEKIKYF